MMLVGLGDGSCGSCDRNAPMTMADEVIAPAAGGRSEEKWCGHRVMPILNFGEDERNIKSKNKIYNG